MKNVLDKIRFGFIVFVRGLKILFRHSKSIQILQLDYADDHIFESSFQPIRYRFRNALWYKFDGRNTFEKELRIFNLPNAPNEFDLVVVGLFRKKSYRIKLHPTHRLESHHFSTQLSNFNVKFLEMDAVKLPGEFAPKTPQFEIQESTVKIDLPEVSFQFKPFNQNELI